MDDWPVLDSSRLVTLARGQLLELLRLAGDSLVVPDAVAAEINRRGPTDPAVRALAETPWLAITPSIQIPSVISAFNLGEGESAVLAWALARPAVTAILDDLSARRCAASLGIPVRGTLGLVLLAKEQGLITQARPVLARLRRSGLYLSDQLVDEALRRVGE